MRPTPLVAALVLIATPFAAAAASGSEVSLTGPASVRLDGATKVPLLVSLTLQNVMCTRDAEIPVALRAQAQGARAALAADKIVFRVASHSALARPWHAEANTHMTIAPLDGPGTVDLVASYQLPPDCHAVAGAAGGEARHTIRVERAAPGEPVLPTIGVVETSASKPSPPVGLQAAVVATALAGVVVVVKRSRGKQAS